MRLSAVAAPVVAAEAVLERVLVDQQEHGHRRVRGPAGGEEERLEEDLSGADDLEDERDEEDAPQLRQRDVADLVPEGGAVDLGGIVELGRDAGQRREIDDHGARLRPPTSPR